ncbi:sensor histidine kinase [Kiloniella sp. b19]|uniref:sensor histidine kinase n=1 Tax=Kiloniella sp. GXU_MW_B19 TaxID=3141326 RepID=UPI0031D81637
MIWRRKHRPKKERTFPKILRKYVLFTLGVTVLFYTVILNFYLTKGTFLGAAFELENFGRFYERMLAENPNAELPKQFNVSPYRNFEDIPVNLRRHLVKDRLRPNRLKPLDMEELDGVSEEDAKYFHLVFPFTMKNGKTLYLTQWFGPEDELSVFLDEMDKLTLITLPLALLVTFAFVVILWLLGRRFSRPSEHLANWIKGLSSDRLAEPVPNFGFQELNQIAGELHSSLVRLDHFVAREKEFLRQASHELRTPITVISGNVELLARQETTPTEDKAVRRIHRATQNMKQLIETLLWLGREIDTSRQEETFDIRDIVQDVMGELDYLFEADGTEFELKVETDKTVLTCQRTAFYIALSNLLRNAFQYTPKGVIRVYLLDNSILVENHISTSQKTDKEGAGHGIGLQLVRKICTRCNWDFTLSPLAGGGMHARIDYKKQTK